jgi:ABC-type sugar transport system substrate-binding protein
MDISRRWRPIAGTAMVLLILSLALGACSSSSSGGSSSSAGSPSGSGGAGGGPVAGKQVSLAMQIGLSNQKFAQDMFLGAKEAAAKSNASLQTAAPVNIDPQTSISQVQSLLAKGPDGIVIWDVPSALWGTALRNAKQATRNDVVTIDTPPMASADVPFVGNNNVDFGRKLAAETIAQAKVDPGTTGTVLVGMCVPQDELLQDRAKGMQQEVAKELPNAKVEAFDSQVDPSKTFTAWQSKVNAASNVVMTLGACAQDGPAMLKATASNASVAVGVSESSPQNDAALASGKIAAIVAGNYYLQGYQSILLAAGAARGKALPSGWIDVGFDTFTKATAAELIKRDSSNAAMARYYASRVAELQADPAAGAKPLASARS